jgi:hypothetical protein
MLLAQRLGLVENDFSQLDENFILVFTDLSMVMVMRLAIYLLIIQIIILASLVSLMVLLGQGFGSIT